MLLALHANVDLSKHLVSFRISNGGLKAGDFPTRLKILNWGVNSTIKGPVTVGPETVKQLSVNQLATGYDRVALDFEHQTVPGSDEYKKMVKERGSIHPLPVAAYGTPVVIPGDGLYLENIEWTPDGKKFAANYHDLSPTPQLNAKGEVIFLHSVALCQQGAVDGLTFYNASFLNLKPLSTPTSMDTPDWKSLTIKLLQALGVNVPDGASDSDIASQVEQYKAPAKPAPAAADPDADKDKDMPTLSAGEKFLLGEIRKLQGSSEESERAGLLTLAASEGKVIPLSADQIKLVPVSALKEMVAKLPAGTVPLNAERGGANGQKVTTLSATEQTINEKLGIKPEDYKTLNVPEVNASRMVAV